MPSEVRGTLVIQAKDEFSQTVKKAGDSGKGLGDELKKGLGGAVESMTGLNLASLSLAGGLTAVGAGIASSIKEAAAWGDEMGDLATKTGMTVKQASTLATVFNDVGLSTGTLEAAIKGATKNGFELNLTTLKKLGAEYRALEDPVERNKFAVQKFGRAGLELTEILSRTGEEIDALAVSANLSGKVIDEKAAAAAENFNVKLKQLEDRATGAKIAVGNALIPAFTGAADAGAQLATMWTLLQVKNQQALGIIDETQAQLRMQAVAAGDLGAAFSEQLVPALEDVTRGTDDLYVSTVMHTTALETHAGKMEDDTIAVLANKDAQGNLNGVWGDAFAAISNLNLAEEEKQRIEDALAIASGKLTAEDILRREAVETLTKQYDNGLITQQQYIDKLTELSTGALTAKESIFGVRDAIASLSDKTVTVTYQQVGSENFGGAGNTGASPYSGGTNNSNTNYGGAQAAGGDYMVTRPTWFLAGEAGPERATFTPQGKGGGNDETNMILRSLPALISRAVRDGLLQVAR